MLVKSIYITISDFQPRDVQIKIATEKLTQGTINSDEFLRRVVYTKPDVSNGMLTFELVEAHGGDEEMVNLSVEGTSLTTAVPQPQQANLQSSSPSHLCVICVDRVKLIALRPCDHLSLCKECHYKMADIVKIAPGPKRFKTKNTLQIKCPICCAMSFVCKSVMVYNS